MMTTNYFQGTTISPYHISIGAVVRNSEGLICAHYFEHITHKGFGVMDDIYLLMRETIEPDESIETCLHRGLLEEFGMKAKLVSYLGSIVAHFPKETVTVEKTTLYFLCDLISYDEAHRKEGDPEAGSQMKWMEPSALITKMKAQGVRVGRADVDESVILERLPQ